ncbi:hypothetical protein ABZ490_44355 [Streptomyces sp. NPDC005811]|uniref:hypothetical protein n=1 Tax=Streptomyces sp. NPDC005811 TaxID=3154565 RepID=UPI0033C1163F
MPTLASVGAGPGMGLAIARTPEKLDDLVALLGEEGVTAAAFPADVLDRPSLTAALDAARARFGSIDVRAARCATG